MINLTIAGNVGKDAETRTTQDGKKFTSFPVAVSKGRDKDTVWFDCTIYGDRGEKVAQYIRKGDKITVSGDVSARAHDGKAYMSIFVKDFTFQGGNQQSGDQGGYQDKALQGPQGGAPAGGSYGGDLEDSIPFAAEKRI